MEEAEVQVQVHSAQVPTVGPVQVAQATTVGHLPDTITEVVAVPEIIHGQRSLLSLERFAASPVA